MNFTAAAAEGSIIYLENVTVDFDGFKALHDLNFFMDYRELRVVIGPNGAGKTTLLDVISGKVQPVAGRVIFGKHTDLTGRRENEIASLGIGRKFQTPSIFANLSVRENLELSLARPSKGVLATLRSHLDGGQRSRIEETLETIGLGGRGGERAGGLSDGETARTAELLQSVARERAVLVIEHDMEFVRSLARKVTVLHEGSVLCEGSVDEIQQDERVREVYLGRSRSRTVAAHA